MNRFQILVMLAALVLIAAGCQSQDPTARGFTLDHHDLAMAWAVPHDHERLCGGAEMEGGEIGGEASLVDLGTFDVTLSAAWDVGATEPDAGRATYTPRSPHAAGPFAPVLGQDAYPYAFEANPFASSLADACQPTVRATGEALLTGTNGDRLVGHFTGGETHRLDVQQEGDGIEVFAEIAFDGGAGRFANATGSAVLHLIAHFDFDQQTFVIERVGVLPGRTIQF
ncbi:MAG: hypothetical protein U5K81_10420 [Trueperaceae bacterium]|nr:hypothetical protein [Trueperaceae bacterium]